MCSDGGLAAAAMSSSAGNRRRAGIAALNFLAEVRLAHRAGPRNAHNIAQRCAIPMEVLADHLQHSFALLTGLIPAFLYLAKERAASASSLNFARPLSDPPEIR